MSVTKTSDNLGAAEPARRPRTSRVTEDAIAEIRSRIAGGEWGPGRRLPREADLAAQLGLSRNSLREAVRALSLIRVLEVRQGDGTYVSSLAPDLLLESTRMATDLLPGRAVLELFEVRRLLEPEAVALAAQRMDDDAKAALKRELDRMFAAGSDVEELVEADAAFHAILAGAPGNAVLKSLLESISSRTVRARVWHGVADRQALDQARAEHTRIYEAIEAGNAELARAAAMLHIETNERWLREHLGPEEDVPLEA
jgi:GntR family transcriptional regulator, transcriptional repressor for pyruvate dehydrogenase complex